MILNENTLALEADSEELIDQIQLLNEYKKAIDFSTIVSMSDKRGIITFVNSEFVKVSGYSQEELIGKPHNIIRHPENPPEVFADLWATILNKKPWHGIIKNRSKNGSTYYVDSTITPILDKNGEIKKFLALRYNISKVIEQKERITQQLTDRLTRLPNRLQLIEDIEGGEHSAMGLINLDSFQELNNLYGYKTGDEILKSFGAYLSEHINPEKCRLYKLPSDEFVILSKAPINDDSLRPLVIDLIQSLDSHLFLINGYEIYLSITVGLCCGDSTDILINSNIALKNAKRKKLPFEIYDVQNQEKQHYANNQEMIKTLKYAVAHDQVIAYYQPIYNNMTGKIDKYETLMRIVNEDGTVVSPFHFLDVAHKTKIYPELTKAILRKAFDIFRNKDIFFSVNLSIEDIRNSNTYAYIFDLLSTYENPKKVIFEIIESEGIDNYQIVKDFVGKIKKYGARIAIDDFGSGYSNFMHLLELETSFIKIDGSIIKNILHDRSSKILTKTIVSMARDLNMKVIAEFVSSKEIQEAVVSMGICHSQGYYHGEPKPYLI